MKTLLTTFILLFCSFFLPTGIFAGENHQGAGIYVNFCAACHNSGMAGAPIVGDKEAWSLRIWQGMPALKEHSIKGFKGSTGYMPAKGGHKALSDAEVISAVEYMVLRSQ